MGCTIEEKKELMYCNSCYLLGVLAKDEENYPGIGEYNEAITIMKNSSNIVFYIKPISDEPIPIKDCFSLYNNTESFYIGIDSHQSQSILPMEYRFITDINKKVQIIKEKLENKIILFRPHIKFKEGNPRPFKNLEIISIESKVNTDLNKQFVCIPKVNMDNETFEKKLLGGNNIILEDYNHFMLPPEYIICGDYLYSNFKTWEKHPENNNMWLCSKEQDKIKRIKFTFDDISKQNLIIRGNDNLIFLDIDYLNQDINNELEINGKDITISTNESNDNLINSNEFNDGEIRFLEDFKQYTMENGLCYDKKDLINFHVSVKTNPLTIVAGMSGTGKTKLARAYAKVLGLTEEDGTLLFLPISPSYTEPEDLLGYLNNTTGLYMSAESGLVDFLINAERNLDKMHMIIFDEMNLSQVEHWFAPFISLLELNAQERKLKIYAKNAICHNCEKYNSSIQIGDNIIFIGTVNLDETTKDFSDRLLDRANIVTLKKQSFVGLKNEQELIKNNAKIYKSKFYSFQDYSSWIKKDSGLLGFKSEDELSFLDNLHELIQKYDNEKGVSFRIFDKIGNYISNIPIDMDGKYVISRVEAFDIQIKQRLLTKIKGTEAQFGNLIGKINGDCNTPTNSELYEFFSSQNAQSISEFSLTKKEICRKARELSLYGYAN